MISNVSSWIADLGPGDFAFATVLVSLLLVVLRFRHRRGASRPALILAGVFGLYLIVLAVVVFCPLPGPTPPPSAGGRTVAVHTTIDLHGFLTANLDNQNLQNVLLLVPFGFGLPFVVRRRAPALFAAVAIVPLGIEGLQLLISFGVGWAYRSVDLNDWIANVAGGLLGLALFAELSWVLSRVRVASPPRTLGAQIVSATRRTRRPARIALAAALAVVGAVGLLRWIGPAPTPVYGTACAGPASTEIVTLATGVTAYADQGMLCLTYPGASESSPAGSSDPTLIPGDRGLLTVVGQAPAGTASARVSRVGGRSTEATLHPVAGLAGWLVFIAQLGRAPDGDPASVRVEFRAADGAPVPVAEP